MAVTPEQRCTHPGGLGTPHDCDGSWRVAWRNSGRTGKQTTTWSTYKFACKAAELVETRERRITAAEVREILLGTTVTAADAGVPTLRVFVDDWIKDRRKHLDVQPDTVEEYLRILRLRVLPHLGERYLTELTEDLLREWVTWACAQPSRRGGTVSAGSVRKAHAVLHQVLGAAVPRWLPTNPAARPPGTRKHRTGLPKVVPFDAMFLEPWELKLITECCPAAIRDLVFVAARTGLRLGELLVLRVQDVILTGKRPRILVRRALKKDGTIGPPKSAKSTRDVTISKDVGKVLTARIAGRRQSALIFTAPQGAMWRPDNLRSRYWLPAVAAAQRCAVHPPAAPVKGPTGPARKLRTDEVSTCACPGRLKRTPRIHDLRHTHASLLVEAGWMPKRLQLRMGHATFAITMDIYGHLWEQRGDAERLDAVEKLLEDEAA